MTISLFSLVILFSIFTHNRSIIPLTCQTRGLTKLIVTTVQRVFFAYKALFWGLLYLPEFSFDFHFILFIFYAWETVMHQEEESRAGDNFGLSTPYPKQFYKHTLYYA